VVQFCLAAADLNGLDAADVGLLRDRVARNRRGLVTGRAIGGAGDEADADVILGDDGGAVLLENGVPARVVAVEGVLTIYLIGSGEIALMAALISSDSAANWVSTIMMPSVPTATLMFPPWPSSI